MAIRRKKIERITEEIYKSNKPNRFAVDIEKITEKLDILIKKSDQKSEISGFLYTGGLKPLIGINSLDHENRQRFSIAHELGHFFLHNQSMQVDRSFQVIFRDNLSSKGIDRDEIEANYFAACLLMPSELIDKYLIENREKLSEKNMDYEQFLPKMAEAFEVSIESLLIRLNHLNSVAA